MEETDNCSRISVIPQFVGTCWFNAILMTCLFSQRTKEVFYKRLKEIEHPDTLIKSFKYIIKKQPPFEYYEKIRAELLLFKFVKKYDKKVFYEFKETFKQKENYFNIEYYITYIYNIFYRFGVNVVSVNYYKDKTYINLFNNDYDEELDEEEKKYQKEYGKEEPPDIIILIHDKLNNSLDEYIDELEKEGIDEKKIYENHESISNFENEIIFMGQSYTLDSCILNNYNNSRHAISGITCGNNKYVYNGWNINTNDTALEYELSRKIPCGLIKFDWDLKKSKEFCLNKKECGLIEPDVTDLCFDFNKGNKVLIYVKNKEISPRKEESITDYSRVNELSNIHTIVYDMYDINEITEEEFNNFTIDELLKFNKKNNIISEIFLSKKDDGEYDLETNKSLIKMLLINDLLKTYKLFNKSSVHPIDNIDTIKNLIKQKVKKSFNFNQDTPKS